MHSSQGPKVLEINSRGGDPEIQTIMPLLKDDFVDICYKMIELKHTEVKLCCKSATNDSYSYVEFKT